MKQITVLKDFQLMSCQTALPKSTIEKITSYKIVMYTTEEKDK